MTLTVLTPQTSDPFGPGFRIQVTTDFVGPLEPSSFWRFTLTAPANEEILARYIQTFTTTTTLPIFRSGINNTTDIVGILPQFVSGQSAQLRIELIEPIGGIVDTADVQVELDMLTGQSTVIMIDLAERLAAQPVGLTTDQGEQLTRVEAGLAVGLGVLPVDLVGGLADALVNGPGLGVGSLSAAYTLTGDGEMPDIATTFRTRLGIYFVATAIPAGLGHKHGQSEEYPSRLVQWRTIHTVGGTEMVTEVLDFTTHGEIWRWREAKPLRIEYSILPGVTLSARWHWWP